MEDLSLCDSMNSNYEQMINEKDSIIQDKNTEIALVKQQKKNTEADNADLREKNRIQSKQSTREKLGIGFGCGGVGGIIGAIAAWAATK